MHCRWISVFGGRRGVTASVNSDDKGQRLLTPISHNDGSQVVNLSFALNVAAGTQKSASLSREDTSIRFGLATEFYLSCQCRTVLQR
jgi:hypothetical protein